MGVREHMRIKLKHIELLFFLLICLLTEVKAQSSNETNITVDSIISEIRNEFNYSLKINDIIGTWTISDTRLRSITFKKNGKYVLSEKGGLGSDVSKKGSWLINEDELTLESKDLTLEVIFYHRNEELMFICPRYIEMTSFILTNSIDSKNLDNTDLDKLADSFMKYGWRISTAP